MALTWEGIGRSGRRKPCIFPRSALKPGANELIVFESDGLHGAPVVEFTAQPELG